MLAFFQQPWSWWVSGLLISVIMFLLLFFGQSFGFSSNLRTLCAVSGAGKLVSFFDFNWRSQMWNIAFLIGSVIGGFVSHHYLSNGSAVKISESTKSDLAKLGIGAPKSIQPDELFSIESLFSLKGFIILALGGFLVGFGSRYAGGCTSGHAISGLSNLQLPSLITVIGFFIGGLLMTFVLLPLIL
jgi:hypothetical protein